MSDMVRSLLEALHRQREIDAQSAAARPHEQRAIDAIGQLATEYLAAGRSPEQLLGRCQTFLERALAGAGDTPDPALIRLQHDVAAELAALSVPLNPTNRN